MKKAIILIIFILSFLAIMALDLSQINSVYIKALDKHIKGNSLFEHQKGYLTIYTQEDNCPASLLIYNLKGELEFEKEYRKVINLTLSENKVFAGFYTGSDICVINLETHQESREKGGILFNVRNDGSLDLRSGLVEKYMSPSLRERYLSSFNNRDESDSLDLPIIINQVHETILSPLISDNMQLPIGNSYAELQSYGGAPYFHPGVDFLGSPNQAVFAVKSGYVKAVLTTGGELYWRVAIANSQTDSSCTGYLYAHLNEASISVNIGDYVEAGQQIGTLVEWPSFNFHHCHFARIQHSGEVWDGLWWTVNNPLPDMPYFIENTPPIFEVIPYGNNTEASFIFRLATGDYTFDVVSGQADIIAKCHDLANSDWKIDIYKIGYKLRLIDNPDSVLFYRHSYSYDMPTDVYFPMMTYNNQLLPMIYHFDEAFLSDANYEIRDYYHIISHTNGDSILSFSDSLEVFDTTLFEDGQYLMTVFAEDCQGNTSESSQIIQIQNNTATDNPSTPINLVELNQNYPNPFNPNTSISFSLRESAFIEVNIYNAKGQLVENLCQQDYSSGKHVINWDARDKGLTSGIYFYRIKAEGQSITRKMILIK